MPRGRSAPAPARSSSSAAARPRPSPSPPPRAAAAPQPAAPQQHHQQQQQQQRHAPPPVHAPAPASVPAMQPSAGGGMMSGLMGSLVTGAAMGTGSAIAHRAVDSFMGPRGAVSGESAPTPAAPVAPAYNAPPADGPCGSYVKSFAECMSRNNGELSACQYYFDSMQQCKVNGA